MSISNCIIINEINSAPKLYDANNDGIVNDNDEFIELYNFCEDDVQLQGYILDDTENGGSLPYILQSERIIKAKEYLAFFRDETNLQLNNSNEEVVLKNPSGEVISSYLYASSTYDKSFQYNSTWEVWLLGDPSVGFENKNIDHFMIEEVPIGETVEILARVIDVNDVYDGFYLLQDDSSSIRIKSDGLVLERGKSYLFLGSAKQLSRYDEFSAISFINSDTEFNEILLDIYQINDQYLDMRVCVSGAIVEVNDSWLELVDKEGDSIKVQLNEVSNADINKLVDVCGIVKLVRGKYDLIATSNDISYKNINKALLTQTGQAVSLIVIGWILLLVCVILSRHKLKKIYRWLSQMLLKKGKHKLL